MNEQKHILKKSSTGWCCETCHLGWKRKPRSKCIGVPVRQTIDLNSEITEYALSQLNRRLLEGASSIGYYNWHYTAPNGVLLGGVLTSGKVNQGSFIYLLSDTELVDKTIPPAYFFPDLSSRKNLISVTALRKAKQQPKQDARPVACALQFHGWENFYKLEDTEEGNRLQYITKTRLKDTYCLSKGWLQKLGDPDLVLPNPHYKRGVEMQLYLVGRVEDFLKERAEEYASWLERRDRLVANSKHLMLYQSQKNRVKQQHTQKNRVKQQHKMCLCCAYSAVFEQGMICAVHPLEFPPGVPTDFYCPDYID